MPSVFSTVHHFTFSSQLFFCHLGSESSNLPVCCVCWLLSMDNCFLTRFGSFIVSSYWMGLSTVEITEFQKYFPRMFFHAPERYSRVLLDQYQCYISLWAALCSETTVVVHWTPKCTRLRATSHSIPFADGQTFSGSPFLQSQFCSGSQASSPGGPCLLCPLSSSHFPGPTFLELIASLRATRPPRTHL